MDHMHVETKNNMLANVSTCKQFHELLKISVSYQLNLVYQIHMLIYQLGHLHIQAILPDHTTKYGKQKNYTATPVNKTKPKALEVMMFTMVL